MATFKNNNNIQKHFILLVNPSKMVSLAGFVGEKKLKFNFHTGLGLHGLNAVM